MRDRALTIRWSVFLLLLAAGCATEVLTEEEARELEAESDDLGVHSAAITRGSYDNFAQRGLIEIVTPTGVCTGALLNQYWAITAAHCFAIGMDRHQAIVAGSVYYFDADLPLKRQINSWPWFDAFVFPNYDCIGKENCVDWKDDIALIRHGSGGDKRYWEGAQPWWSDPLTKLDGADYLRLNGNGRAGSGSISDIGTLKLYGRGYHTPRGGGSGTMRQMPISPSSVDAWSFKHRVATANSPAACVGDSGGPIIGTTGTRRIIAGIHSSATSDHTVCTPVGGDQLVARIDSRINWIVATISDGMCLDYAHFTRCW